MATPSTRMPAARCVLTGYVLRVRCVPNASISVNMGVFFGMVMPVFFALIPVWMFVNASTQ